MASPSTGDKSKAALILVDLINHFEFSDGAKLLRQALPIAPSIVRLKRRAKNAGIPVIYVNDNFGQWRSNSSKLLEYCLRAEAAGKEFVHEIQPDPDDYFVLKPMHSAFYQTPLDTLLRFFGATTIILCGLATNSCVVCTAHDANMRELRIFIPSDCCAARTRREHQQALEHVGAMADARVMVSTALRLKEM